MVINHKLKVIFIKSKKTAGTSFEIALSKYCGQSCIITSISDDDEKIRKKLGFRGPQNYKNYFWKTENIKIQGTFVNHTSASALRKCVPESIWNNYKKITIVRNPFDIAISRYYWEGGEKLGLDFYEYLISFPQHLKENETIIGLNKIDLDIYLRYENLEEDLENANYGYLYQTFKNIKAKSNKRPKIGTSPREMYLSYPKAFEIVANACKSEIKKFQYFL